MGLTQNSGLDPVAQQLLGDAEIVRDLPERPAALLGQLDRLTTELLRVRGTRAWHAHHIPSAGSDRPKRSGVHETGGTPVSSNRHNASVRIERSRENVFIVTATSQELSALVAGARMALEAMRAAPEPPPKDAIEILERVLRDFDHARERLTGDPAVGG